MNERPLDLVSEPFGSLGNLGENISRLLGAPSLDPLETVVREAVQNVFDAALPRSGPEVVFRIRRLTEAQRCFLKEIVFHRLPREPGSRNPLKAFLDSSQACTLEICDFNTSGLAGPTRADCRPIGPNATDFIDFIYNAGIPRNTAGGGGTYGFGKAALFRVSRCRTILVDSLVAGKAGARRLIGYHMGPSFSKKERGQSRLYTGRHWWGLREDNHVEPLTGVRADQMAAAAGFMPRPPGRSGTSIMILDFAVDNCDSAALGRRLVELLLWYFWPRMLLSTPHHRRLEFSVEVMGHPVYVPSPEEVSPLDLFAKAMEANRQGKGNHVFQIRSKRPKKLLGCLSIEKGLRGKRHAFGENSIVPPTCHHIALMRPVELVVKYLDLDPLPDERSEWAGVFVASSDAEVESAFARAEPPAHDDWRPASLEKGRAKTFVSVALREIAKRAREIVNPSVVPSPSDLETPWLAKVADKLGERLHTNHNPRPVQGGRARKPRASRPVFKRLEADEEGRPVAVFSSTITQDSKCSGKELAVTAAIAIDGTTDSRIAAADMPSISAIRSERGGKAVAGDRLALNGRAGAFEILVQMPVDCAVAVKAQVMAEKTNK